jgi:hypothetical protein
VSVSSLIAPSSITRRRAASFLRRGKRETREGHLRSLWLNSSKRLPNSKLETDSFFSSLRSGVDAKLVVQSSSSTPLSVNRSVSLRAFALAATPFVSLRTRRQARSASKRPIVKIGHLSSRLGLRKALVSLTNSLQTSGAASQPFVSRLRRQLEPFSSITTTAPVRQDTRDTIHRQAFQALPAT